jgi:NAD(P)-dependent dehydrogenase (short-subunit alcohol dehydrogenase family)
MYDVSGKRALITGGAQGFGRQFARRLLQKGCRVCITDIDQNKGQETKKEFQEQFGIKENRFRQLYLINQLITDILNAI